MNERETRECVRSVLDGDVDRFEELVHGFGPMVRGYVYRVLRDEQAAEEVTVDVFRIAWQKLAQFDCSCRFSTWLVGIARREALSRRRERGRRVSLDAMDEETGCPSVRGPEEEFAERIRNERLVQALSSLAPRQREAVLLFYEEGLSYREIAERMRCSVGAVEQLIHRAMKNLGRLLGARVSSRVG